MMLRCASILLLSLSFLTIQAKDLTKQEPLEQVILLKGKLGYNHYYDPNLLTFYTGKLYKLVIKNVSNSKHYFSSNGFARSIFTRKIQILNNNNKVAEIKGVIDEVEVWPNQKIEWWFVPIKTGIFNDLNCKIQDINTNKSHDEMGMKGIIIIK